MKIEITEDFSPSKIVCVGRNYADHAAELGNAVPKEPLLFLKAPSSLLLSRGSFSGRPSEERGDVHPQSGKEFEESTTPSAEADATPFTHAQEFEEATTPSAAAAATPPKQGGEFERTARHPAIVIPQYSQQVEHEGELGVVIGRVCQRLSENEDPFAFVLGYTCLNDVTARDVQRHDVQFTRGKSFDTFCPVGPHIETELDVSDLRVVTRVNGVIKQDGRTSQMVFPVGILIRYISNMMTLMPGDVIATGTPSGVSRLSPGDLCEVEIEGIGTLINSVSAAVPGPETMTF